MGQRVAPVGEGVHDEIPTPSSAPSRSAPAGARARSARRRRRPGRSGAPARTPVKAARSTSLAASSPSCGGVVDPRQVLHARPRRRRGSGGRPRSCPSAPRAARPRGRRRSASCAGSVAHSSSKTGVCGQRDGVARARARPAPSRRARSGTARGAGSALRARRVSAVTGRAAATIAANDSASSERAADQRAVDVGQRQQLGRVLGLDQPP